MDRRRFIPVSEKVEGRMMLSTMNPMSGVLGSLTTTVQSDLPVTIQQKTTRIDRIPTNMRAFDRNRPLPRDLIEPIQQAMTESISSLDRASQQSIESFNEVLRDVVSRPTLSARSAQALNNALTGVLVSAGATTQEIDTIADNLHTLATTINTTLAQPVFVTTNDYATVLQMTLIVGQPMPAPNPPMLARDMGATPATGHFVTNTPTPTFTGTYQARATLQIYDQDSDVVFGQGQVEKNGQYKVTFDKALAPGEVHTMRIRAIDDLGHVGRSSRPFTVRLAPRAGQAGRA